MANFTGPVGLNTFSHILLNTVTSVMMKNEFNICNNESSNSVSCAFISRCIFQIPKHQITAKLAAVNKMETGYAENIFLASDHNTQDTISNGNMVNMASTHLKVTAALPFNTRSV